MTGVLSVIELCLRRWWYLPIGGLLFGLFAAFSPFGAEVAIDLAVGTSFVVLLGAQAVVLAALIAPTHPSAPVDFFFARPVPWWSIWLGRLASVLLVVAGTVAGLMLPAWLRFDDSTRWAWRSVPAGMLAGHVVFFYGGLVLLGYAASRARRPIATIALAAAMASGMFLLYRLALLDAMHVVGWSGLTGVSLLPGIVFSMVYLAVGRGEPVRAAVYAGTSAALTSLPLAACAWWLASTTAR